MLKNLIFNMLILPFILIGCSSNTNKVMLPLELQEMQSRTYENNKNIIFASVISVFQDMGYSITNADKKDTGLIYAESPAKTVDKFFVQVI